MDLKRYESEISVAQYEQIKEILESVRKRTKARQVNLYKVFCAVLYVLKSGCQWRMLPKDYPNWVTVYSYFCKWNKRVKEDEASVLEQALKKCGWRGPYQPWSRR